MKLKYRYLAPLALAPLLLANDGCDGPPPVPDSQKIEQKAVSKNQDRLLQTIPPPQLDTSLERANLVKRLQRLNAQNMSGCVYLISQGSVMAMYPVSGKVTSLNAYLMAGERIVRDPNGGKPSGSVLMEQPDFDGAYGKNADGIFFFTADTDAYVEWGGDYVFTDQCLGLNGQQPRLERQVK